MKKNRQFNGLSAHMAFAVAMMLFSAVSLFSCSSCKEEESPDVQTVSVALVAPSGTQAGATVNIEGKIISTGSSDIISYGFCLSENPMPTINDTKKELTEKGISSFKWTFSNLNFGKTYYFRAYAMNAEGTSYGRELSVETSAQAAATTLDASAVNKTGATLNGLINPRGLPSEVSIEYGETSDYGTRIDLGSFDGDTAQNVSAVITGLTSGKIYYFVIKINNSLGAVSGQQKTFETCSVEDRDGNFYHTVTINGQTWLRENLKVTHYLNGEAIPNVENAVAWAGLNTGAWCWYNNDPKIGEIYGGLYNWFVINDSRGFGIEGWHVPTVYEYLAMKNYLGGTDVAGPKLMETGSAHWKSPNRPGTNSTGFTALPNGGRSFTYTSADFIFFELEYSANWWTNSSFNEDGAIVAEINSDETYFYTSSSYDRRLGSGIRLVKN